MFMAIVVVPYCVSFAALAFWWRLRLLLPAIVIGVSLWMLESNSVSNADGPGSFMAMGAFVFISIGAISGAVASALIIVGRRTNLALLRPLFVLPLLFSLGFGSYFVDLL